MYTSSALYMCYDANAKVYRTNSIATWPKLKRQGGAKNREWTMMFNAIIHAEPYHFLHLYFDRWQVLHGCRQFVFWDVRFIPTTNAIPDISYSTFPIRGGLVSCFRYEDIFGGEVKPSWPLWNGLQSWRKCYYNEEQYCKVEQIFNRITVRIVGCNSPTWRRNSQ